VAAFDSILNWRLKRRTDALRATLRGGQLYRLRRGFVAALRRYVLIVGLDLAKGVVHASVLFETATSLELEIRHLPVTLSCLARSVTQPSSELEIEEVNLEVQRWRDMWQRGECGAFSATIEEARRLAWETSGTEGAKRGPLTHYLEFAIPLRTGKAFHRVRIAMVARSAPIRIEML